MSDQHVERLIERAGSAAAGCEACLDFKQANLFWEFHDTLTSLRDRVAALRALAGEA